MDLFKKPLSVRNEQGWLALSWFSSIEYKQGQAKVEFEISPKLKPYLLNLQNKFTKIQLEIAIKFSGKYTTRFYQFLMKLQNTSERKEIYKLSELYDMLVLPKSLRNFGSFKLRVLSPSLAEINEKTSIKADFEIVKNGKKYDSIILSYADKQTQKTSKARVATMRKFDNRRLSKYKNVEFVYSDLYTPPQIFVCEKFIVAPELNQAKGQNFMALLENNNGGIPFDTIQEFEKAIEKAKELKLKRADEKSQINDKRNVAELFEKLAKSKKI